MSLPLSIEHWNRIKHVDDRQTVTDAANALHCKEGELALLMFYCFHCRKWFRPSALFIADTIGVSKLHVYKLRNKLAEKTLIYLYPYLLAIDWERLRLFASMNPAKTKTKNYRIGPPPKVFWDNKEILELTYQPIPDLVRALHAMREVEYAAYLVALKRFYIEMEREADDIIRKDREEFLQKAFPEFFESAEYEDDSVDDDEPSIYDNSLLPF